VVYLTESDLDRELLEIGERLGWPALRLLDSSTLSIEYGALFWHAWVSKSSPALKRLALAAARRLEAQLQARARRTRKGPARLRRSSSAAD
jgi:hypothetical protein